MQFVGPNGHVLMASLDPGVDTTRSMARSLVVLDTSKTKWLEIIRSDPLSEDFRRALVSMKNLQTLTLSLCKDLRSFILALAPVPDSTNPIACPNLERLVFRTEERFDVEAMVEVATARALVGTPLISVKIISWGELVPREGVRELLKYVLHVKTSPEFKNPDYGYGHHSLLTLSYSDDSDEKGWAEESFGIDSVRRDR